MQKFFIFILGLLSIPAANAESLQNTVQQSLATHPEINASVNSRYSAEQDLRAARGGYLPSLNLDAEAGKKNINDATTRAGGSNKGMTLSPNDATVSLNQNVFDGFATSSEVDRQKATVDSRAFNVLNISETTAFNVVQAYLDVLQRQEYVHLAEDDLANHERIYDQIRLRTDQGVGRSGDLMQAEARLAQARNNLVTEQTNLEDANTTFLSVTGEAPENLSLPESIGDILPKSLDDAKRIMESNSPLLKSANADIQAAHEQYETSKSTFYPRVDVAVSRSISNDTDTTRAHSEEWQAMVKMHYNLYQGGSDKAAMQSRAYLEKQAQDVRNNTLRQMNQEIGLAWSALKSARDQIPSAADYADRSVKVRTAYQDQFSLGERTLLDLLDSENEVFSSKRRLVELRYLEISTGYRICARIGELLKALKINPAPAGQPIDSADNNALPELN
ncbi:agglutination protein [Buttiauxella brennerae ATCC 51605]|jgi:adhesin transport system outer membrane protein|uniref:Agglutination protein n=1 Tax=Buttiauxella brennerae ATCC 51605 TaxID=1354251 RepID=A0A1B7IKN9_9ENTR|nr:TolC family outer membrane protein [Buttiauxella brennerae]OAT30104.1 agglutination protein [Buttiauxella brennerae ATCC 51605]